MNLKSFVRKGRKTRLIVIIAIIAIIAPLAINTLLNMQANSVKADSFFKFDEGYGTTSAVKDTKGVIPAGSITNAVWKTEDLCKVGKCLYFDGTGDYVSFTDNPNLDMTESDNVTIEFWFRTSDITSGTRTLISKYETGGSPTDGGYKITMNSSGQIVFGIDSDDTSFPAYSVTTPNSYDDNRWHFLSLVKSGTSSMTVYVDAVSPKTATITSTAANNNDTFYIGIDNGSSNGWLGFIDEVNIVRSARTSSEVLTDYMGGSSDYMLASLNNGLVGYWKMDESTWGTPNCSTAVVLDSSVNDNNGTACPNSTGPTGGATGKFGNGGNFDGSNDYASVPNTSSIQNLPNGNFAASVWFKADTLPTLSDVTVELVSKSESGTFHWHMGVRGTGSHNQLNATIDNVAISRTSDLTDAISTGLWYHYVMTYSQQDRLIHLYLNGTEVSYLNQSPLTGSYSGDSSVALTLGAQHSTGDFFDGIMDDARIYNRTLSDTEIKFLYGTDLRSRGTSASFGPEQSYLSQGLVGYWRMDEAFAAPSCPSNDHFDSSGNGNYLYGCPAATGPGGGAQGRFGNGVLFDGSEDYLYASSSNSLGIINNSFALSAWIYPTVTSAGTIIIKGVDTVNNYKLFLSSGKICVGFFNTSPYTERWMCSYATVSASTWTHVVGIYDNNSKKLQLYINGNLDKSGSGDSVTVRSNDYPNANADYLYFGVTFDGSSSYDSYFQGTIDDSRIYNRALSPGEIAKLYNWAPGPVGWWKLDENTGTAANDTSGNNYNASLTNIAWATGKYGSGLQTTNANSRREYASLTDQDNLDFTNTQDYTLSAWVKLNAMENIAGIIVHKGGNTTSKKGYDMYLDSTNTIRCGYVDGDGSGDENAVSTTLWTSDYGWHYYSCVMDRYGLATGTPGLHIFVDGKLEGSDTSLTEGDGGTGNSSPFVIGENDIDYEYSGAIDDVKVYRYARTPAQIIEDMNAGHPAPGSPVGSAAIRYKFDEGYGNTIYDTGATGAYPGTLLFGDGHGNAEAWKTDCKFDHCIRSWYSGGSDWGGAISSGDLSLFDSLTQMTLSFWVKPDTLTANYTLVSKSNMPLAKNGGDQNSITVSTDPSSLGDIRVYIASSVTDYSNYFKTSNLGLANNNWAHLVIVYDGTQAAADRIKVYKNGIQVLGIATGTIPASLVSGSTSNFSISGSDSPDPDVFIGLFDEFKLYTIPLNSNQVITEYNRGFASVMGSLSNTSSLTGGSVASNSASAAYCVPGSSDPCSPPVAEWKFDENTGSKVYDTSGNGHSTSSDCDLTHGGSWTSGKFGSALNLLSADSCGTPSADSMIGSSNSTSFTLSAWVNLGGQPPSHNAMRPLVSRTGVCNSSDSMDDGLMVYTSDDSTFYFEFRLSNENTAACSGGSYVTYSIPSNAIFNTWYFLEGTYEASTKAMKLYVNGKLVDSAVWGGTGTWEWYPSNIISFGYHIGNVPFKIDDAKIYKYVRTPAQVAWDYNHGAPVAWYKFDECSGSTAYNLAPAASGRAPGMDGTIVPGSAPNSSVGTCTTVDTATMWYNGRTGKYSGSLDFDGSAGGGDDAVTISADSRLNLDKGGSISAWIYPHSSGEGTYGRIIDKSNDADGGGGYSLAFNSQYLMGQMGTGKNLNTRSIITLNTWTHVVWTFDSYWTYYINGQLDKRALSGNLPDTTSLGVTIGNRQGTTLRTFDGLIDDVKIFNYALTPEQVKIEYNQGSAVRFGP